ncbi:unnamed protein product, partial [Bubo scandiacus]
LERSGADVYLGMMYRSTDQTGSESNSCTSGTASPGASCRRERVFCMAQRCGHAPQNG